MQMRGISAGLLLLSSLVQAADSFKNVEYLYKAEGGDKGQQVGGRLNFDSKTQTILFDSKKVRLELQGSSITSALYERTSRPRYVSGLLLAWPLLFTKSKKHFLTIQYKSDSGEGKYAIFHLDKGNYREILAGCGKKTRWDVTPEQIWSSMLYARR
jgi:hypothetical protein